MAKIIERIALLVKNKRVSTRAFETSIGASNGVIRRAILNNTDISAEWLAKIIESYPDVSADWLLTGEGEMIKPDREVELGENCLIDENRRFLDRYYKGRLLPTNYEDAMIRYYSAFPEKRIEELLALEIDLYEERYNYYSKLVDILLHLEPHKSIVEKFKQMPPPFKEYLEKTREEFEENVTGLKDNKLKNILYILTIKDESEHYSHVLGRIIGYLDSCKAAKISRYNRGETKG